MTKKKTARINISQAGPEDVDTVAPLFDAYRQFYGTPSDLPAARRFLSARLKREESVIFFATRRKVAVGFTQLYPLFSSVVMKPIWLLNDLFVAAKSRKLGVGEGLVEAATAFAKDRRAARLILATATDNLPAQFLYEKLGWQRDDAFLHYTFPL